MWKKNETRNLYIKKKFQKKITQTSPSTLENLKILLHTLNDKLFFLRAVGNTAQFHLTPLLTVPYFFNTFTNSQDADGKMRAGGERLSQTSFPTCLHLLFLPSTETRAVLGLTPKN